MWQGVDKLQWAGSAVLERDNNPLKSFLRPISLIGIPSPARPKKPMICSSLYLLVLMSIILHSYGLFGKIAGTGYEGQVTLALRAPAAELVVVDKITQNDCLDCESSYENNSETTLKLINQLQIGEKFLAKRESKESGTNLNASASARADLGISYEKY